MSIPQIILAIIVLYYGYKVLNELLGFPLKFRRKRLTEEEIEMYLKMLLIRGYVKYGKRNGRMYIESMMRKGRKIIVRKYDFRNEIGMCVYVPEYEKEMERKIRNFLIENKIEKEIWREWRKEFDKKVLGVDIGSDIDKGVRILKYITETIFKEEKKLGRLKVYFRYMAQSDEYYDFPIEKFERDPEKIKQMKRYTNWMGLLFGWMAEKK